MQQQHIDQHCSIYGSRVLQNCALVHPSSFVNHQAASSKLHQTGIVTEYQQQFETLSNRVNGMSPESN